MRLCRVDTTTDVKEKKQPKYTEEVGEEDSGFYDTNGVFHENIKGKMMSPPDIEGVHFIGPFASRKWNWNM